jgi:hypothetical protein
VEQSSLGAAGGYSGGQSIVAIVNVVNFVIVNQKY